MTELDSILGKGVVAPEPKQEEIKAEAAPKDIPEAGDIHENEPDANVEKDEGGGQKMVPHEALHAEKQKVKRYTEQVADFEKKLSEQNTAWEQRFEKLIATMQPQKPQEEKPAPDFWESPDDYLSHKLGPVQAEIQKQRENFSLVMANEKHGEDAVKAAYEALAADMRTNPASQEAYRSIMQSQHPYGALVDWHKKRQVQAEIGNDPAAYREKLKAEILAEIQGEAEKPQPAPQATPPVMPSNLAGARNVGNRSGPAWSGPQSLTDIFDRTRQPQG